MKIIYTLPESNIAHENPHLSSKYHQKSKWWIFHGYVSLPVYVFRKACGDQKAL